MSKDKIQKTLTGTFWSMTERFAKMGIQILCTFIIAQFVAPSEFGLVSMMSIFLAFSTILIDSGFSQALIHEQHVTQQDESSIFWFNIALGIGIYGISSLPGVRLSPVASLKVKVQRH